MNKQPLFFKRKSTYNPCMNTFIHKHDAFGVTPPNFNIEGRKTITTFVGFVLTIFAALGITAFTAFKFMALMEGRNAIISS